MTCTKLRHIVSTMISAVLPEEAKDLAKFMCHSGSVQQGTYNEILNTTKSIRLSNLVGKLLTNEVIVHEDLTPAQLGKFNLHLLVYIC